MTQPTKETLLNAILAMDSYNRGYFRDIAITDASENSLSEDENGKTIGIATIIKQSGINVDPSSTPEEIQQFNDSFYAVAYEIDGKVIISYRGTDTGIDATSLDVIKGFGLASGNPG